MTIGPAILGIGAAVCGADWVLGLEIDESALGTAAKNCESIGVDNMDFIQCDISQMTSLESWFGSSESFHFDTAVINPPFGTKKGTRHLDMKFLEVAAKVFNCSVIYSFHKTATREHIPKAAKALGFSTCEVLYELKFKIPKDYGKQRAGHVRENHHIDVDLVRLSKKK